MLLNSAFFADLFGLLRCIARKTGLSIWHKICLYLLWQKDVWIDKLGGTKMEKRTSVLQRALCLALTLVFLGGCSPSNGNSGSGSGSGTNPAGSGGEPTGYQDTIIYCPKLDFITQDMHNTVSNVTKSAYLWVYNTLVELDVATQEIAPALATSWEQTSDTQWKFILREGVKFHNGNSFTAEDVKFSFEIANQGNSATRVNGIESMEVVDEYTILINLKATDMDFLYRITAPEVSILSKNAYDTMEAKEAVKIGTGPYMYGDWEPGDYISFHAFHDYWGGAPKTEHLILRYIPEASARLIALQTGEVDIIQDPSTTDLKYVAENTDLRLEQYPSSTVRYLSLNQAKAPFDNELVRQAIAHAINYDEILTAVYQGNATSLNNVMHSDNAYYSEVEGFDYNVEKAKQLLADAGYPNGFSTTILTTNAANDTAIATLLQSQLAKIGITVDCTTAESAAFSSAIAPGGTYDMMVSGYSGYTYGPDAALRTFWYSSAPLNYTNNNDPYVDELLDRAVAENDEATRQELYAELENYITNKAAFLPIAIELNNLGMKKAVEGMVPPNGAIVDLRNICIPVYN